MIIEVLFVVDMFLWLLTLLPFPAAGQFAGARPFLAYVAVLLLGVSVYAGIR